MEFLESRAFWSTLEVVDSHHHFWDPEALKYSWLFDNDTHPLVGHLGPIQCKYDLEDLKNDTQGFRVEQTVHVEAACSSGGDAELEWLVRCLKSNNSNLPTAIVSHANLLQSVEKVDEALKNQIELGAGRLRGIRHMVTYHPTRPEISFAPTNLLQNEQWLRGFAALASNGLSFDLQIYPNSADDSVQLARMYPSVPLVINHAILPVEHDPDSFAKWVVAAEKLSQESNVFFKLSGIPACYSSEIKEFYSKEQDAQKRIQYVASILRPYVRHSISKFGANRVLFGSNFPVDKIVVSYKDLLEATRLAIAEELRNNTISLSNQDIESIFASTAKKVYRL